MTNTIIDVIRIPIDKDGNMVYDTNAVITMMKTYKAIYPDHEVLIMPENIKIWENVNIDMLRYLKQQLEEIIQKKEKQDYDL